MIAVDDLAGAIDRFRSLGFDAVRGGRHEGLGTENAIVRFGLDYLELLAVHDADIALRAGADRRALVELLRTRTGAVTFALAVRDIAGFAARVARAGLRSGIPVPMKRVRPGGEVLSWRVLRLPDAIWMSPWPFFIEWDAADAERLRVDIPGTHPNGVSGVSGLVVAARDIAAAADGYGAFGLAVAPGDAHGAHGATCRLGAFRVEIVAVDRRSGRSDGEGIVRILLRSADVERTRRAVSASGASASWDGTTLTIDPAAACGAHLAISADVTT